MQELWIVESNYLVSITVGILVGLHILREIKVTCDHRQAPTAENYVIVPRHYPSTTPHFP